MIETSRQREKREKAESAERSARQERYLAKHGGAEKKADGPMSEAEARVLTKRIVDAADGLAQLLLEAKRREAWKVLGYDSWRSYAIKEFRFAKSQVYRLLDHAETLEVISPIGEKLSESVTRPLAKLPIHKRSEAFAEAVVSAPKGKPTANIVKRVVDRLRGPKTPGTILKTPKVHPLLRTMKAMWKRLPLESQENFRAWIADGTK